jgi:hypothetical protein
MAVGMEYIWYSTGSTLLYALLYGTGKVDAATPGNKKGPLLNYGRQEGKRWIRMTANGYHQI